MDIDWGVESDKSMFTSGYVFALSRESYHGLVRSKTAQQCRLWRQSVLLITIETKDIAIKYIFTNIMIANPLTKPIFSDAFKLIC